MNPKEMNILNNIYLNIELNKSTIQLCKGITKAENSDLQEQYVKALEMYTKKLKKYLTKIGCNSLTNGVLRLNNGDTYVWDMHFGFMNRK